MKNITASAANIVVPMMQNTALAVQELQGAPQNLDAEQALLANLLHDNIAYEHIGDFLRHEHFADIINSKIFQGITRLIDRGQVADPITLRDYFEKDNELKAIGGAEYLAELAASSLSISNTKDYGRIIYDLYLKRQLIHLGHEITTNAQSAELDSSAINQIETAEQYLYDLSTKGDFERGVIQFRDALNQALESASKAYKRDSKVVGITTGFRDVDESLGGLHPSDLIIIAGRPAMGKTALATNIAFNAAKATLRGKNEGAPVAFFSLEMSAEQLAQRILSSESGVTSDKIRRGDLRDNDFMKFAEVSRELASLPLFIDDTPALTISAMRTRCRRLKRKEGLGLIVVDYLQLIQGSGRNKNDGRVNELSEITRQLKALAKELDVPVIALSQLSRAVESRDDKRPQLADLRESGSIEQDADIVSFVYRQAYYDQRNEPDPDSPDHAVWAEKLQKVYHQADLIIAKQRHGPVGTIKLYFDSHLTRFGDLEKYSEIR